MRIVRKRARSYRSRIKWLCRLRIGFEKRIIKRCFLFVRKKRRSHFFIFFPDLRNRGDTFQDRLENDNYSSCFIKIIFQFRTSPGPVPKMLNITKEKIVKNRISKRLRIVFSKFKIVFKNLPSRNDR